MKKLLFFILLLICFSVGRPALMNVFHRGVALPSGLAGQQDHNLRTSGLETEHFSPHENLETLDIALLRKAHRSIDVAMYAFTDRQLVAILKEEARRGVPIRLYRDQEQFENEQHHATLQEPSTTQMLTGISNIHIRVKQGSPRDLMHSKSVLVDGETLRDGSANWSAGALRFQDNNWFLTGDRQIVSAFAAKFEEMWTRPTNLIVQ